MSENKSKTYVLSESYLQDLLQECREQISTSKDLICDFINGAGAPKDDFYVFPVAEILFCNMTMAYFIDSEIGTASPLKNKETGENEFLLSEEAMALLQSMAVSRYYANISLNKICYSVSLH
mgnify:FL=1